MQEEKYLLNMSQQQQLGFPLVVKIMNPFIAYGQQDVLKEKELLEYAINDSKEKGKSGICALVSKKKKPFIGEKKFFEHYGFKVLDTIGDYELLALQFDNSDTPKFNDSARLMKIDNQDFTIYYSPECPYVENELTEYAKENNIKINFIKIDTLEKAKNAPCIFNNWANFYKGEFVSNTILNANSFKKLID